MDARVVVCDIAFNTGQAVPSLSKYLNEVGEALETVGSFHVAGQVYEEAAETHCTGNAHLDMQRDLYLNGGFAFKRNCEYDDSERLYVLSLYKKWLYNRRKLKPKEMALAYSNLMMMYADRSRKDPVEKALLLLEPCLLVLFHFAGLEKFDEFADEVRERICIFGIQYKVIIRKQLQNKKSSFDVLQSAMGSGDVDTFHSKILACRDDAVSIQFETLGAIPPSKLPGKDTKFNKESARSFEQSKVTAMAELRHCSNPECSKMKPSNELMQCPCHKVSYCQKSCQTAHWSVHRMLCPHSKLNRNKTKKTVSSFENLD